METDVSPGNPGGGGRGCQRHFAHGSSAEPRAGDLKMDMPTGTQRFALLRNILRVPALLALAAGLALAACAGEDNNTTSAGAPPADRTAPTVLGVAPGSGSSLTPETAIAITFSEAMRPASLVLGGTMTGAGQVASPYTRVQSGSAEGRGTMTGAGQVASPYSGVTWSAGNT